MNRKRLWTLALVLLSLSHVAFAANECKKSDIVLDKFTAYSERSVTKILGRIINRCHKATGVQIKVVFYDKTGVIRKVEDMWPASVNNIEPHSPFPFEVMIDKVNDFEKVEASIIQVTAW